jgi:hypothetical protein
MNEVDNIVISNPLFIDLDFKLIMGYQFEYPFGYVLIDDEVPPRGGQYLPAAHFLELLVALFEVGLLDLRRVDREVLVVGLQGVAQRGQRTAGVEKQPLETVRHEALSLAVVDLKRCVDGYLVAVLFVGTVG